MRTAILPTVALTWLRRAQRDVVVETLHTLLSLPFFPLKMSPFGTNKPASIIPLALALLLIIVSMAFPIQAVPQDSLGSTASTKKWSDHTHYHPCNTTTLSGQDNKYHALLSLNVINVVNGFWRFTRIAYSMIFALNVPRTLVLLVTHSTLCSARASDAHPHWSTYAWVDIIRIVQFHFSVLWKFTVMIIRKGIKLMLSNLCFSYMWQCLCINSAKDVHRIKFSNRNSIKVRRLFYVRSRIADRGTYQCFH